MRLMIQLELVTSRMCYLIWTGTMQMSVGDPAWEIQARGTIPREHDYRNFVISLAPGAGSGRR
jgi:hypothetical protein